MEVFEFVLAIVFIATIGGLAKEAMRHKHKSEMKQSELKDQRIEALEERVATLERIVTDDKDRLKREIDDLHRERA